MISTLVINIIGGLIVLFIYDWWRNRKNSNK